MTRDEYVLSLKAMIELDPHGYVAERLPKIVDRVAREIGDDREPPGAEPDRDV